MREERTLKRKKCLGKWNFDNHKSGMSLTKKYVMDKMYKICTQGIKEVVDSL